MILTYGSGGRERRILIDAGRKATYADLKPVLARISPHARRFELLVVSHIDRDHIEGMLELIDDPECPVSFTDVWFNGYHHLLDGAFEELGAVQGERLSEWLKARAEVNELAWNGAFGGTKAAGRATDDSVRTIELPDALTLSILSPTRQQLRDLVPVWERECKKAGIVAGRDSEPPDPEGFESLGTIDIDELAEEKFEEDHSEANGSSIALLAEYRGRRLLLGADAFPSVLLSAIRQLGSDPLKLDAFKIPHHGSRKNLSKELLGALDCRRYLFSSNGSYFHHPDPVSVSRVIKYGGRNPELWFNYRSDETTIWDESSWQDEHGYSVHYPDEKSDGYRLLELETD